MDRHAMVVDHDLAGHPSIGQQRPASRFGIALPDDLIALIQYVEEDFVAPGRRAVRLPEEGKLGDVARRQPVVEQAVAQQRDRVSRLGVLQVNIQQVFGCLGCPLGYGIDDQTDVAVPGVEGLVGAGIQPTLNEALRVALVRGPQDGKDPPSGLG
jgi:hypothetical protein